MGYALTDPPSPLDSPIQNTRLTPSAPPYHQMIPESSATDSRLETALIKLILWIYDRYNTKQFPKTYIPILVSPSSDPIKSNSLKTIEELQQMKRLLFPWRSKKEFTRYTH